MLRKNAKKNYKKVKITTTKIFPVKILLKKIFTKKTSGKIFLEKLTKNTFQIKISKTFQLKIIEKLPGKLPGKTCLKTFPKNFPGKLSWKNFPDKFK